VKCLLIKVSEDRAVIGEVKFPLEEGLAATGARFAIRVIAERIVGTEAFTAFTAANAAGDVILSMHNIVPNRFHGTLIVDFMCIDRNICHSGIGIHRADGMTDGFVLLDYREMALVVFRSSFTAIKQEFCQSDISITLTVAFEFIDESAESN